MARFVVVGSGFAGVEAALKLSSLGLCGDCVWVTERARMVFSPLLPMMASGRYPREKIVYPIAGLARRLGFEVVEDRVTGVEQGKLLLEQEGALPYDYAVLAPGARPAFYGVPGAEERAVPLYTPENAERIREAVRRGAWRIVIVGAGLVGVELAAELAWLSHMEGLDLWIRVVDMLEKPLQLLGNPKASALVERRLRVLGVEEKMGQPVASVEEDAVVLKNGERLEADLVVWCAGVRGPGLTLPPGAGARGGYIAVDESLAVPGLGGRVYAAGDATSHGGRCPPMRVAREALEQARVAARNAAAAARGLPVHRYKALITTCCPLTGVSMGPGYGVVVLGRSVAFESPLPHHYHEAVRRYYEKLFAG